MTTETAAKPTVVEALSRVMDAVQAVRKGDRNPEQGYSFRGIDAVVNAVGPELRKHGVIVMPIVEESTWRDVRTSRDKPARECTVRVRYRFYGPAGDHLDAVVPGESMDFGDKGAAKAMSVAFRIALLQALCIPTDEVEPDAQTYERVEEFGRESEPTPEQTALFDEYVRAIAVAASEETLRGAWESAKADFAADRLTAAAGNELRRAIADRRTELQREVSGDSTAHAD